MLHQNENSFVVSDKEKREQRFLQMSVAESKNFKPATKWSLWDE